MINKISAIELLLCPNCGEVMQLMKTTDKYRCTHCKTKVQQLDIFSLETHPRANKNKGGRLDEENKNKRVIEG